jgi:hypothetical protein
MMNGWMLKIDMVIGSKNLKTLEYCASVLKSLKNNIMNGWMLKKDVRIGCKNLKAFEYYN